MDAYERILDSQIQMMEHQQSAADAMVMGWLVTMVIVGLVSSLAFGYIGSAVAKKEEDKQRGFWFGFIGGLLGVGLFAFIQSQEQQSKFL